jgi:hypothetical protein
MGAAAAAFARYADPFLIYSWFFPKNLRPYRGSSAEELSEEVADCSTVTEEVCEETMPPPE